MKPLSDRPSGLKLLRSKVGEKNNKDKDEDEHNKIKTRFTIYTHLMSESYLKACIRSNEPKDDCSWKRSANSYQVRHQLKRKGQYIPQRSRPSAVPAIVGDNTAVVLII